MPTETNLGVVVPAAGYTARSQSELDAMLTYLREYEANKPDEVRYRYAVASDSISELLVLRQKVVELERVRKELDEARAEVDQLRTKLEEALRAGGER